MWNFSFFFNFFFHFPNFSYEILLCIDAYIFSIQGTQYYIIWWKCKNNSEPIIKKEKNHNNNKKKNTGTNMLDKFLFKTSIPFMNEKQKSYPISKFPCLLQSTQSLVVVPDPFYLWMSIFSTSQLINIIFLKKYKKLFRL